MNCERINEEAFGNEATGLTDKSYSTAGQINKLKTLVFTKVPENLKDT